MLVAAALVAIAVAAPFAQARHTRESGCSTVQSPNPGWVVVSDDQGVPWLYPAGYAPTDLSCTSVGTQGITARTGAAQTDGQSPTPGWISITDDQGVPWLYPAGDHIG